MVDCIEQAAECLQRVTGIEAYDVNSGLGWLLINKTEDENYVSLIPEPVELTEGYDWVDIADDENIDQKAQPVLLKIVRNF